VGSNPARGAEFPEIRPVGNRDLEIDKVDFKERIGLI
jgi:hypothetical protein